MKKKIFLISLLIVMLGAGMFSLAGCGKKNVEEKKEEVVVDETLVKINGLDFHLKTEATFKDIKYTIADELRKADYERYIQYNYLQEDSTNLLFFRIFYYGNKSFDEAAKDLGIEGNITLKDGKTNNIEYKLYEQPRNDGGTIHFYFIDKDGSTYVINFVSKYDIKDFENKVVKSLKF